MEPAKPAGAEDDFGEAVRGFLGWPSAYPSAPVDAAAAGGKGSGGSSGANGSANASVNVAGGGAGGAGGKAGANISITTNGKASGQSDADTSFHGVFASLGAMFPSSAPATSISSANAGANAGYGSGWQSGDGGSAKSAASVTVTGADEPGRGRRPRSTYAPIDAAGGEDAASRAKRDALARQRGPAGAYWRSASDLDAGAQPSWWDWRGLSETEQSQWIATAIMIIVSAAAGWFVLNGGMARFAVKASAVTFAPLARGARAGFASAVTSAADLMQLLLDSVAVAWSLLVAPFVGFGQSVSRFGVSSADRASSLLSAFNPRVYDVPAMPYGARPGPQGAAAAAGYGGYGPAAGMQRGAAFAPLLPSPGSMYAAPARGFRPGARPPVQLPGARNAQRFAPGARAPARMRTPEQEEQDRRAELFHSGRCGSNNPDVELCDSIKQRRWSAPRDRAGRPINADVPVRPLGPQYAQTHTALAAQTAHAGFYAAQQQQQGFAGGAGSQAPFEFGRPAQCPPKRGPAQCPPKRGPPPPPPPPQCAGPPPSCLAEAQAAALSQAEALAAESAAAAAAEAAQLGADGECDVWLAAGDAAEAAAAQEAPPAPEGDHLPICGAEHDALPICSAADMAAAAPAPAASKAEAKQAAAPAAAAPVAAPKAASLRVPRSGGDLSAMQRSRAAAFAAAKCGSADADAAACKALLDTALEVMVPGGATVADAPAPATPAAAPSARASLWKRLLDGAKSAKPAAAATAPAPAPVVGEAAAAPAEPAAVVEAGAPAAAEAPAAAPAPAGLSPVARRRVAVAQAAASCASARGASDAAAAALRASQTHLAARLDAAAEAHAACRAMLPTNGSKPSRATAERHDACLRQSDKLAADAEAASDDFEAAARDAERLATVMVEICGAVAAAA